MTRVIVLAMLIGWPGMGRWFGADKAKHFLMSALVHSATYAAGQAAGLDRSVSQGVAGTAALTIGVFKEVHDRRSRKPFSVEDLAWDAAGALSAASLLNGAR